MLHSQLPNRILKPTKFLAHPNQGIVTVGVLTQVADMSWPWFVWDIFPGL